MWLHVIVKGLGVCSAKIQRRQKFQRVLPGTANGLVNVMLGRDLWVAVVEKFCCVTASRIDVRRTSCLIRGGYLL